jgi:hypothetical protein
MAYSTEAELRARLPELSNPAHVGTVTPAWCASVIADADMRVRGDVIGLVASIAQVTDVPPTPDSIRLLAKYAAMEEALIRLYGRSRVPRDKPDIDGARTDYERQLRAIENREVGDLAYVAQVGSNYRDAGLKPNSGMGKYGEYVTSDTPGTDPDDYDDREET